MKIKILAAPGARHSQGFTLIELVIVVVLLGILAAVAIPRFLDVTKEAEEASVEGVAGGFAVGVGLVRAQWELEGRPKDNEAVNKTFATLDGVRVGVDKTTGYPTGHVDNDGSSADTAISNNDCASIFNLIMQSAPTITSSWGNRPFEGFRYFTRATQANGSGGNDLCFYYLSQSVRNVNSEPVDSNVGSGFVYDARIGQVIVFTNNDDENIQN